MTEELRKLLRFGGPAVWLMVGAPVLVRGAPEAWRLEAWGAAYLAFAAALFLALRRPHWLWLLVQAASVIALVLVMCDGFEGALLVLVALQLGGLASRRAGLAAVVAQSAALAAAVAVHWTPGAALLLAPPYLGFQLLAFFAAEGMSRLADARGLRLENERLAERLRISRELHDRLGHHLTALRLNLEAAARSPGGDALEAARGVARTLMSEIRGAVEGLREPERLDVCTALRTLAGEMPGPRVHVDAPEALPLRDPACALAVLRCAQEIATNAARHSAAENLWIELRQRDGVLELSARDDGRGAAEVKDGNGLRGMRERIEHAGGTLRFETGEGKGFSVRATLPLRGGAMIRVCLVENETLVREGLRRVLELDKEISVVGEARDGEEALPLLRKLAPDVALLDVRMPRLDGVGVLEALRREARPPPCLVLTTFDDADAFLAVVRAGARGYLLKDASPEELGEAIRAVARGESWLKPAVTDVVLRKLGTLTISGGSVGAENGECPQFPLTEREVEVLRLLAGGYSNREIGGALGVAERTVKNHVSSILAKLWVRDRTRAVLKALSLGLL